MARAFRDIGVPLLFVGIAFFLGWEAVTVAFVVVGYAHFLLGYVYRVSARRESLWYLVAVPVSVLALFAAYFAYSGDITPVFLVTALIFAAHFAFDEFFLHDEQVIGSRWITVLAFLGIDFLLSVGLVLPAVAPYLFLAALVLLVLMGVYFAVYRTVVSTAEWYLGFVGALLFLIAALGSAELVLGAIVLLHCYNWYDWGHRRAATRGASGRYWRDVGLTLGLSVLVWGVAQTGLATELAGLYALNTYYYYYYPLAVAHIATSVRFG